MERQERMKAYQFSYMMLSRLLEEIKAYLSDKDDCRYRNVRFIWGDSIQDNIQEAKRLYKNIPNDIKPEWCSLNEILKYEKQARNI